ncbi:MAG: DUF4139 domain-containing protein [Myxococcota bacterium]
MLWLSLCSAVSSGAEVLPVRRVRLYETGVGWFEREGRVRDGRTQLPLPQSHLDDALKSLVVLGDGATVDAITFPSALSDRAARTLAGLDDVDGTTFGEGLTALVGEAVAVRTVNGGRVVGTLLSVESIAPVGGVEGPNRVLDVPTWGLGILTPEGALVRVLTTEVREVQSLAPDPTWRLEQASRSFASARAQQRTALQIDVSRGGQLAVGYLAETAVWRVTYRLVANDATEAQLQAWALVHNDTDEDWSGVTLEVANGQPRSFLYPLAAPRYARRDLEVPETPLSTVAQLAAVTPDGLWDETDPVGVAGFGTGGTGYGSGGGGLGLSARGSVALAPLRDAEPVDTPTQFVVRAARPVNLQAHHSALVPLGVDALHTERVVALAPNSPTPRTAVWMRNDTVRTLPAGVIAVVAAGGLSGETVLARTKPKQAQMLLVGEELDVDVTRQHEVGTLRTETVAWRASAKRWHVDRAKSETHTVQVRNRSGRPRPLWVAIALPAGSSVDGDLRSEVDPERGWTWIALALPEGPSRHEIPVVRRTSQSLSASEVSSETYRSWADQGLGDPTQLRRAASLRDRVAVEARSLKELEAEAKRLEDTRQRLREDLDAAKGSAARSVTRRLANVEQTMSRITERHNRAQVAYDAAMQELTALLSP